MTASSIDWPRVLAEIAWMLGEEIPHLPGSRTPIGMRALGVAMGVPRNTLRRWIEEGAEPRHCDGELVLKRWMTLSGKRREFAPVTTSSLSAAKARV